MFLFHLIFWISKKVSGFGLVQGFEEVGRNKKNGKQFLCNKTSVSGFHQEISTIECVSGFSLKVLILLLSRKSKIDKKSSQKFNNIMNTVLFVLIWIIN